MQFNILLKASSDCTCTRVDATVTSEQSQHLAKCILQSYCYIIKQTKNILIYFRPPNNNCLSCTKTDFELATKFPTKKNKMYKRRKSFRNLIKIVLFLMTYQIALATFKQNHTPFIKTIDLARRTKFISFHGKTHINFKTERQ